MINKIKVKSKNYIYILILLLIIVINDKIIVPLPAVNTFFNYNMSQWGVTYQDGFVFRGLIGSAVNFLGIGFTDYFVYFSLILLLSIYLISIFPMIKIYKMSANIFTLLFVLFLLSQPSNIRWWKSYGMFGSMDMFIFIIFLINIILIVKIKKQSLVIAANIILSIVGMLINEYFIFIYVPLITSVIMYKEIKTSGKLRITNIIIFLVPVIVAGILIFSNGTSDLDPVLLDKNIRSNLKVSFDIPICYNLAYDNIYYFKIGQKIARYLRPMKTIEAIKLLVTIILLLPSAFIFTRIFIKGYKNEQNKKKRKHLLVCAIAALSPLLGVLVSNFYYMWIGYVIIALSTLLITLMFIDDNFKGSVFQYIEKHYIILGTVGVYNICLGTIYVASSYGWIETLIKHIA